MKNEKFTIVHVEDYFDPTMGYQINELLMSNIKYNDNVHLITSNDLSFYHKNINESSDQEFEDKYNIKIHRYNKMFKVSHRIKFWRLFRKIEKLKPDLVFLHSIGDFKDLILYRRKRSYIVVRDCHMSWVSSENKFAPLFYRFFKIFFSWIINRTNKYEKVFALGVEESQYLRRIGINEKKIELLPHGYNENTMFYSKESRAKLKEHYMIDDDKIIISYIGKFNNYKEPDLIFDIAARLPPKIKNRVILYFIGFKSDEYMKKFNKKLNIYSEFDVLVDEGVPFTQLHKYFSMSDICIFPKETTLSSIHAQVCGCEVIMENHDSNKERVVNQDNLYNIDDLDQAASILERIIINKEYLNRNKYIDELKNREYSNQVKKLRQLIIDKRKEKK